ncbi:hypothetical protein EJ08DRAFT_695610 [Tothia fuscella]|uniref:Uncharacterized protein n=1 Tax=Tothia fuscella TaxID=1048955 RepID=A0A9P4TZZ2_9PEZI|nr:hypothetical protein EJ08DRAFT_695610 [Tothia fuscella]
MALTITAKPEEKNSSPNLSLLLPKKKLRDQRKGLFILDFDELKYAPDLAQASDRSRQARLRKQKVFPFQKLPAELRNLVYGFYMHSEQEVKITIKNYPSELASSMHNRGALLKASRMIRYEVTSTYLEYSVFKISDLETASAFLKFIGPRYYPSLRHLHIQNVTTNWGREDHAHNSNRMDCINQLPSLQHLTFDIDIWEVECCLYQYRETTNTIITDLSSDCRIFEELLGITVETQVSFFYHYLMSSTGRDATEVLSNTPCREVLWRIPQMSDEYLSDLPLWLEALEDKVKNNTSRGRSQNNKE